MLILANECCGTYEFYNPERLLRKAMECQDVGYDPVAVLEKAVRNKETDCEPVRILSEIIERER